MRVIITVSSSKRASTKRKNLISVFTGGSCGLKMQQGRLYLDLEKITGS